MKELEGDNQWLNVDRAEIDELWRRLNRVGGWLYVVITEYSRRRPRIRDFGRILLYFKSEINAEYDKFMLEV